MNDDTLMAEAIRGFLLEKHLPFDQIDDWAAEIVAIVHEHRGHIVPAHPEYFAPEEADS